MNTFERLINLPQS